MQMFPIFIVGLLVGVICGIVIVTINNYNRNPSEFEIKDLKFQLEEAKADIKLADKLITKLYNTIDQKNDVIEKLNNKKEN